MTPTTSAAPRPKPATGASPPRFDGWRVVAAAFVVAVFGWGLGFYGPPVYLEAVRQTRGWPIALISGAVTLHFLAGVGVVANLPALHRRFGLPCLTPAGGALLAVGSSAGRWRRRPGSSTARRC